MTLPAVVDLIRFDPSTDSTGTSPRLSTMVVPLFRGYLLRKLSDEHYDLRIPIPVELIRDGENWIVSTSLVATHGFGSTKEEAIEDFQSMLIDLYEELWDSEDSLAPHLLLELRTLEFMIQSRPA